MVGLLPHVCHPERRGKAGEAQSKDPVAVQQRRTQ